MSETRKIEKFKSAKYYDKVFLWYDASDSGRIFSKKACKFIKLSSETKKGFGKEATVSLMQENNNGCRMGERMKVFASIVIASTFVKNDDPENKKFVLHINGNLNDNNASNLKWVTEEEYEKSKNTK